MDNELIRLSLVILLSIGVIAIWKHLRPDLRMNNISTSISNNVPTKIIPISIDKNLNQSPAGIIVTPMYKIFKTINKQISNVGWTIVVVTFILKLLTLPLQFMGNQITLRTKNLKKDLGLLKQDKMLTTEQVTAKTLELMKKHKVNPMHGIFSLIIQAPLFFALYSLLQKAPELHEAYFISHISNLSLPDPFFVMPIASVAVMTIQIFFSKDGSNKKIVFAIAIVGFFFMVKLPSGIQLYILVSTCLTLCFNVLLSLKKERDLK